MKKISFYLFSASIIYLFVLLSGSLVIAIEGQMKIEYVDAILVGLFVLFLSLILDVVATGIKLIINLNKEKTQ